MATVVEECPALSAPSFSEEELKKLMGQGKRHFLCNEILEAVKCFQEACRLLGEKYGQTANECGNAYYQYGRSLLELARVENGVLGNALEGVPEESDSDEEMKCETELNGHVEPTDQASSGSNENKETAATKEGAQEETTKGRELTGAGAEMKAGELTGAGEAMKDVGEQKEVCKGKATDDEKKEVRGEKEAEEEKKEKKTVDEKEACQDKEMAEKKDTDKETEEKKEGGNVEMKEIDESEDVSDGEKEDDNEKGEDEKDEDKKGEDTTADGENDAEEYDEATDPDALPTIQLAWEMLELARIIFRRNNNQDSQLKLAQTHLLLGEINMEQEQFPDAIVELTKCLNIQKKLLKPDDRLLAETYYNLGVAYSLAMDYDASAKQYELASEVLGLRITNIKERMAKEEAVQGKGKGKASEDDIYIKDKKELSELEELLPEVKEKCLDAQNESIKMKNNIKEQLGETIVGFGSSSTSATTTQPIEVKKADNISHLVKRVKRKPETTEDKNGAPSKKARQDDESATINGDGKNADNATKIADNATKNVDNATKITDNATNIADNATNIADNVTNIADNATKIADNATKISDNVTKITGNATTNADSATETTDGATNADRVTAMDTK